VRNLGGQIHNFHVGRLQVDERLFTMVVTKIIVPRGTNQSTLNGGDMVLMYCIKNGVIVDWTYTIKNHMMKEKWLTNFNLPHVVLISKFI